MTTYTVFNSTTQFINLPSYCWRVYALTAPLSILKKKMPLDAVNNLIDANLYTLGIGIQSVDNNLALECTFDYGLVSGNPIDAVVPTVSGTTLTWNNAASVYIGSNIDRTYWYASTYIATINNSTFQAWQQDMLNYGTNNPYYTLFATIAGPPTRADIFNPLSRSSTSSDFVNTLLNGLTTLSVPINYATAPFINVYIITNIVVASTSTVPTTQNIAYYNELISVLNPALGSITIILLSIANTPAGDYSQLITLYNILIPLVVNVFQTMLNYVNISGGTFTYYGYPSGPPGTTLTYYSIGSSSLYGDYIQSNLMRSVIALGTDSVEVLDPYTSTSGFIPQGCGGRQNNNNGGYVPINPPDEHWYIIVIIVIAVVLFIWLLFAAEEE